MNETINAMQDVIKSLKKSNEEMAAKMEENTQSIKRLASAVEDLCAIMQKALPAAKDEASAAGSNAKTAQASVPYPEAHRFFKKVDPSSIKPYGGDRDRLVPWLIELKQWVVTLGLRSVDDLFIGHCPFIRRFLTNRIDDWFHERRDVLTSYSAFHKALCRYIIGDDVDCVLEKEFRERVQREGESIETYAFEKEKMVEVCLANRQDAKMIAQRSFCSGLLNPHFFGFALGLLASRPLATVYDIAHHLRFIEAGLERPMLPLHHRQLAPPLHIGNEFIVGDSHECGSYRVNKYKHEVPTTPLLTWAHAQKLLNLLPATRPPIFGLDQA